MTVPVTEQASSVKSGDIEQGTTESKQETNTSTVSNYGNGADEATVEARNRRRATCVCVTIAVVVGIIVARVTIRAIAYNS